LESEFVHVAGASEIQEGKMKKATLDGKEIIIVNVAGKYYAVSSLCTHFGGDLSEGVLEGKVVICPNHKASFDVTTGKLVSPPTEVLGHPDIEDLPTYLLKVIDNDILVKPS
jgi:nitrite reductase/ring-hydroxylating ferredoxin subunit